MSLWNADDASTKNIMVKFYNNLKSGDGKLKTLRKAEQQHLALTTKEKNQPFYWVTIMLAGEEEPVRLT